MAPLIVFKYATEFRLLTAREGAATVSQEAPERNVGDLFRIRAYAICNVRAVT